MLWKTPSNMWRSISPVTCTGNQGKVTPSQPGCQHVSGETGGLPSSCGPTTPIQRVECFWRLLPELFLRTHGIKASAWTHGFVLPEIFFFPSPLPPSCAKTLLIQTDNLRYITEEKILQIWAGFIFYSCCHQLCLLYNLLATTTALLSYLCPPTPPEGFSSFRMESFATGFSYKLWNKREVSLALLNKNKIATNCDPF